MPTSRILNPTRQGENAMHFGLSEEQDMIVNTVRAFVENEIYPHEAMVERTGQVPLELGLEIMPERHTVIGSSRHDATANAM